jgi:hypothetical protein
MLDLNAADGHVARAVLLPLDCSRKQLRQLLTLSGESETPFGKRFDEYCVEALKGTDGPKDPPVVEFIHEIATFAALAAVRVEFADPLPGTHYHEQFPEHSSERRMMTRPLRKHPGLSRFTRDVRNQYVYNVLYAFRNLLPEALQREIVAALFSPDSERKASTPRHPARIYCSENESLSTFHSRYVSRVTQCEGGYEIPFTNVTARPFIEPVNGRMYLPSPDLDELPPLSRRGDTLFVPEEVVFVRLANYAWHGWYRLVSLAYQTLSDSDIRHYVEMTPRVAETIRDHLNFRKPNRSFIPYYGAASQNPLVDPNSRDTISRPDKRLVTVADTIRASSTLNFDEPILLPELFAEMCQFFPSPARPGNDVSNKQTLKNALESTIDDRFNTSEMVASYEIPVPVPTPFAPRTKTSPWKQYRHELATLTRTSINIPDSRRLSPFLPEPLQPSTSSEYATSQQHVAQAAVSTPRYDAPRVMSVQPLVDPSEIEELSAHEILFLSRIGLAMERRIGTYSLTESMASFRNTPDGSELDIDIAQLKDRGVLSQPTTPQTYYSVPGSVRKQLGITNVSHDGWGERAPSEGTLHRIGIDLLAFLVASRPDVDRVVRYCDAWRLQPTDCWDAVSHLEKKRLDVVGFSQGDPTVIGEVETKTGGTAGTQGTMKKLRSFPDRMDRYFVTPSGKHLSAILSRLSDMEHFDVEVSKRKQDGYRPAEVREVLTESGAINNVFDQLLTYYNIRRRLPNRSEMSECADRIVGAI